MKVILTAALLTLAGCGTPTPPAADAPAAAVSAHIQKNAHDPASYEPGRFSAPQPLTRRDSVNLYILSELRRAKVAGLDINFEKLDALKASAAADTVAPVGVLVRHTYRLKNAFGALVLDSADFVVWNDGRVTVN